MNIITRAFMRMGLKKNAPYTALLQMFGKEPIWTKKDIANLAKAGYEQCMTVYACVSMIGQGAATIPWLLYKMPMSSISKSRRGKLEEIDEHPLLSLINRPNRFYGQFKFIEELFAFYLIAGNNYLLAIGPDVGSPMELWNLKPHRVRIIPGNKTSPIKGYRHYANPANPDDYTSEQILHLKCFAPLDDWYGLSPLEVAGKGIDISNMAQTWNMKLLQNDMRPPGMFKVTAGFKTQTEREIFNKNILESYTGYQNAGLPLVGEGDVDWKPYAISPKDADWIQSDKLNLRRICTVLHVPSILLGDTEATTYSNYQEARKALYMEGILPIMSFLRDELNNWLVPQFGERLRLDYDRDKIEALQEDRNKLWERINNTWCLSVNQKLEALGYENIGPSGNVIFIPMNFVPLEIAGEGSGYDTQRGEEESNQKAAQTKLSFWQAPERKKALLENFKARVTAKEKPLISLAEKYLHGQADRVKKVIGNTQYRSAIIVNQILNENVEAERWKNIAKGWYVENFRRAGDAGMRASKGELYDLEEKGTLFNVTSEKMKELENMILKSGTKITETTMQKIMDMLKLADVENWTVEQLTQEISAKLHELSEFRARRIARTESTKVENWGQLEGYRQIEYVELKGWLCSFVKDSRQAHMDADREYSNNPIPLNEDFIIGGVAMSYPGDPRGGPENDCNCLCSTFPELRQAD